MNHKQGNYMDNEKKQEDPFGVFDLRKSKVTFLEDGSIVFIDYFSREVLERYPELSNKNREK